MIVKTSFRNQTVTFPSVYEFHGYDNNNSNNNTYGKKYVQSMNIKQM